MAAASRAIGVHLNGCVATVFYEVHEVVGIVTGLEPLKHVTQVDHVTASASLESVDRIGTFIRTAVDIGVAPGPTVEGIMAEAAIDDVVAVLAADSVIAG